MTRLIADMSMSLDGFVARPDDNPDHLFDWMFAGDVEVPLGKAGTAFRTSEASAEQVRGAVQSVGAILGGRRYFDLAQGWGGEHPMGVPVVVLTHSVPDGWPRDGSSIVFNTEGLASAVEQAKSLAGGKNVPVAGPTLVRQCLDAGVLDEVSIHLVPIVLGGGYRYFPDGAPAGFEDPEVVAADGVLHLTYAVKAPVSA
jgi:dihydrofolate reductase